MSDPQAVGAFLERYRGDHYPRHVSRVQHRPGRKLDHMERELSPSASDEGGCRAFAVTLW